MNSFVHGGIHPLQRSVEGFPVPLAMQVLGNSNALSLMTGMVLANLSGDEAVGGAVGKLQVEFSDCLPALRRPVSS